MRTGRIAVTRSLVLFSVGLVLTLYEAIVRDIMAHTEPRPFLVALYMGMMGLPAVLPGGWTGPVKPPDQRRDNDDETKDRV